ncbi:NTPase KAP family P-loop domain-containing protein 1, partial [Cyanistes caeruleus]|uniref:NTPase KAP family P-loop domain-containing protein 1 n=1 Tax=Cyanistes caeruleus TaxID=156563 RepID=UPI000CDA2B1E
PPTEDDVYCRCLSRTLCHTATPVTVGFYAPCGHRLETLLAKVTAFMREEMARREAAELQRGRRKPRSPHGWGLLLALWLLAFYEPVVTEGHLRRKNLEFIFIRFSAWEFAGCDKLWAGLVTTLCHRVRQHFGALPLSVFHVLGSRPRFASGPSRREWILKRGTCLRLWGLLLVLAVGIAILLVALLVPGIKDHHALKVVRRIVNTIPITLRLLLHRHGAAGTLSPRAAAAWVVLADRWPCRLSWTLQCLEDSGQGAAAPGSAGRSLWSVFQDHVGELSALRQPLGKVLSLDGDPELFQAFLARDFPFGAAEARELLGVTVNLDHSIRHQMGLLRALQRLGRTAPVSRGVQCAGGQ